MVTYYTNFLWLLERFSNDCKKTTKVIAPPNHNSGRNQSEFLAITCNSLKARGKSRVQGAIGFDFASHWLKNWRGILKPITECSNSNRLITFDNHLKTGTKFIQPVIRYWESSEKAQSHTHLWLASLRVFLREKSDVCQMLTVVSADVVAKKLREIMTQWREW